MAKTKKKAAESHKDSPKPAEKGAGKRARKPVTRRKAARDMDGIMALDLPFAQLDPATEAYFAKCREKIGYVPNVLLAYAHDMAKLQAFAGMYNDLMLAPSGLSKLEREMIAVAVSAENRCLYCLVSHGAAVRQYSGDPKLGETMLANWRAWDFPPRQRAMLDFAIKMTKESHTICEADRQKLRDEGFSERDIWDIASVAAFYNMSNRLSSALDMRPNDDYFAQAR